LQDQQRQDSLKRVCVNRLFSPGIQLVRQAAADTTFLQAGQEIQA
jgi:hypothetical protein